MKRLPIKQSGYDIALEQFATTKRRSMLVCHDDQDMKELIIQRLEKDLTRPLFISPKTELPVSKDRRYIIVHEPTHTTGFKFTDATGRPMHASRMIDLFLSGPVLVLDNFESLSLDFMEKFRSMLGHYGVPCNEPYDEKKIIFLLDKIILAKNEEERKSMAINSYEFDFLNPLEADFGLDTEPFKSRLSSRL